MRLRNSKPATMVKKGGEFASSDGWAGIGGRRSRDERGLDGIRRRRRSWGVRVQVQPLSFFFSAVSFPLSMMRLGGVRVGGGWAKEREGVVGT
jgi:hypothetical protein